MILYTAPVSSNLNEYSVDPFASCVAVVLKSSVATLPEAESVAFPVIVGFLPLSGNATLSASGKVATDDFNTTAAQLANGSTEYSLKFDETGAVYNITVGRGGKLYYIDTNLADDMPGADTSLGDDGYAVVNSTRYIVAFKYPLPNT